jgi:hypothetical protein
MYVIQANHPDILHYDKQRKKVDIINIRKKVDIINIPTPLNHNRQN